MGFGVVGMNVAVNVVAVSVGMRVDHSLFGFGRSMSAGYGAHKAGQVPHAQEDQHHAD